MAYFTIFHDGEIKQFRDEETAINAKGLFSFKNVILENKKTGLVNLINPEYLFSQNNWIFDNYCYESISSTKAFFADPYGEVKNANSTILLSGSFIHYNVIVGTSNFPNFPSLYSYIDPLTNIIILFLAISKYKSWKEVEMAMENNLLNEKIYSLEQKLKKIKDSDSNSKSL